MSEQYFEQVDLTQFVYKKMTKTQKGSNVVYIADNPHFQLNVPEDPYIVCPFGASSFDNENTERLTLDMSIENDSLVQFFQTLDQQNIAKAIENKKEWFKSGTTDDQIKAMYYPLLKFDQSGKGYAPILHAKVNADGNRKLEVYKLINSGKNWTNGNMDDICKRFVKIMAIVTIGNLWFQARQFGMTIFVTNAIIIEQNERKEFPFSFGSENVPQKLSDEEIKQIEVALQNDEERKQDTEPEEQDLMSSSIIMSNLKRSSEEPTQQPSSPRKKKKRRSTEKDGSSSD